MKRFWFTVLAGAMGALGCGSDSDEDPTPNNGGGSGAGGSPNAENLNCSAQMGPIDPSALIDDFEDGNARLPAIGGRQSDWWITTDETPNGTVTPPPGAAPPERIIGGRCDSLYAQRYSGQGFEAWGTVMSVSLRYEEGTGDVAQDLSAFRGLRFWARVGELNTAKMRIGVHDVSTHPNGGICDPDTLEVGTQCYDSFGTDISPLGKGWQEYAIHFDRLEQREFGVPGYEIDTSQIYQIDFTAPQGTIFDFWVDDIWLFE
jgi:hypothetical protein